jgi:hypothetical protein
MGRPVKGLPDDAGTVVREMRVMHERLTGSTHKDTATNLDLDGANESQRIQAQSLKRWGAESLQEYRPRHAGCLRAVARACEEQSRDVRLGKHGMQFAASLALICIVMHNEVEEWPMVGTRK